MEANETYAGENELNRLNNEWLKAMSEKDYEKADQLQRMMDRVSERAIAIADAKLRASLRRY